MTFTKTPIGEHLQNKNKTMKYTKYIIGVVAVIALLAMGYIYHTDKVEALKNDLNAKLEEANKPSEIERIQGYIKTTQIDIQYALRYIEMEEQELERDKKAYKSIVWQKRCYEISGQLEFIESEKSVDCITYGIYNGNMGSDMPTIQIVGEEEDYAYLEKFASYNIEKTKQELGL